MRLGSVGACAVVNRWAFVLVLEYGSTVLSIAHSFSVSIGVDSRPPSPDTTIPNTLGAVGEAAALGGVGAPPGAGRRPLGNMAIISGRAVLSPDNAGWLAREVGAWRRSRLWRGLKASALLARLDRDQELQASGVDPASLSVKDRKYPRVTRCKWAVHAERVEVNYSPKRGRSFYTGLCTCGSWSACPVCGSRIAAARAVELGAAINAARARGMVIPHLTFTLPHRQGDDLTVLVDRLVKGFERIKRHRRFKEVILPRFGVDGPGRGGELCDRLYFVRSFECTWGYNGYHPHLHVLVFLAPGADWGAFADEVRRLWYVILGGGFGADGLPLDGDLWDHCLKVTCTDADLSDYLTKLGGPLEWDLAQELTMADRKLAGSGGKSAHYSMLQVLLSYADTGNELHGRVWSEYARAMRGRNFLTWSHGLRQYLGVVVDDRSDEQVAEEGDEDHITLSALGSGVWELVRGGRDYRAALLAVADTGDASRVREWLQVLTSTGWPPGVVPGGSECILDEFQRGLCDE